MLDYDRSNWWGTCFSWRGTILPHVLGMVGLLTGFCLVLYLIDELVLQRPPLNTALPRVDSVGHSVLGVALSMLIVFRTNSSNNRFWEARTLWGAVVNAARNLVRLGATAAPPADDLARLVTAYVLLVKEQLRDNSDLSEVRNLLPGRLLERLAGVSNHAQVLAGFLTEWVLARQAEGRLDPLMAQRMETLIGALVDNQGGCERIHRTPLPFVYAALIKQILFVYLVTLPFVLVPAIKYMAPMIMAVVSLGMLGIEEAGVEVEDPFGPEANHLPLDRICAMIGRDVSDLTAREAENLAVTATRKPSHSP